MTAAVWSEELCTAMQGRRFGTHVSKLGLGSITSTSASPNRHSIQKAHQMYSESMCSPLSQRLDCRGYIRSGAARGLTVIFGGSSWWGHDEPQIQKINNYLNFSEDRRRGTHFEEESSPGRRYSARAWSKIRAPRRKEGERRTLGRPRRHCAHSRVFNLKRVKENFN